MDILTLILRHVREAIEATGAPPDALQDALAEAEHKVRRTVGGAVHHISRVQPLPAKVRVLELHGQGLNAQQISERLGVTDRYARMVIAAARGD
jgi:hypothetical protein